MTRANTSKPQQRSVSPRLAKLNALAQQAVQLGGGILKERVAVPNPTGGYKMVVREIKA